MTVTIGVPIYNVSDYVERCLRSLWSITVPDDLDIQLIIVDDASPDDSMTKVTALLNEAPVGFDIQIVNHASNRGLASARNTILEHAVGSFIWFVDSDDWVHRDMLDSMMRGLTEDVDIVVTGISAVGEEGQRIDIGTMPYTGDQVWSGTEAAHELFEFRLWAFMWNKLVRRDLYRDVLFPPGRTYEDTAVMALLFARARRVRYIDESLYSYAIRPGAITDGLKIDLLNLSRNVRHVAAAVAEEFPDLRRDPALAEYVSRVAHLSALHHVAEAHALDDVCRTILREVAADIRLGDITAVLRGGRLAVASALLLARTSPTAYVHAYRLAGRARRSALARRTGRLLSAGRAARSGRRQHLEHAADETSQSPCRKD